MKTALTIAGSDSGGGAGIQADLKTFMAHGVYGTSALTAITAQNTLGVHSVLLLDPDTVKAQVSAVLDDIGADAVKTGMLGNGAIVDVVVKCLNHYQILNVVVDPVMVSSSGRHLVDRDAIVKIRERLMPLSLLITPNLPEAGVLLGRSIQREEEMRDAARDLVTLGARNVLLKGGHLRGDAVDLLYDGQTFFELRSPRLSTRHTHGTGCTFASAIAALLARGLPLKEAVAQGKAFMDGAILHAQPLGHGHGPVNHLFRGLPLAGQVD